MRLHDLIPISLGFFAAAILIVAMGRVHRYFESRPLSRRQQATLLGAYAFISSIIGIMSFDSLRPSLLILFVAICCAYAALGTLLEWPGFRPGSNFRGEEDDWWRQFPNGRSLRSRSPGPNDVPDPRLRLGTAVLLKDRPDRLRRVLKTEWHYHRHQFVYIVETSAPAYFEPYWFAEQLETK